MFVSSVGQVCGFLAAKWTNTSPEQPITDISVGWAVEHFPYHLTLLKSRSAPLSGLSRHRFIVPTQPQNWCTASLSKVRWYGKCSTSQPTLISVIGFSGEGFINFAAKKFGASQPSRVTEPTQTQKRCTSSYRWTDNSSRSYGPTYTQISLRFGVTRPEVKVGLWLWARRWKPSNLTYIILTSDNVTEKAKLVLCVGWAVGQ